MEEQERQKIAERTGLVGMGINLVLFVVKFAVGMFAHSVSVTADAFNNLSDASSSVVSFVGSRMAGKPADEEHPFGHGRIEYIAAFIVAFIIIEVGFSSLKDAIAKILHPEELVFSGIGAGLLILSVGVKLWMSFFYKKVSRQIQSSVYAAASSDSLFDVLTTASTIVSMLLFGVLHLNLDGWIGLVVSAIVMYNGFNIAKDTLEPLIGERIDPQVYEKVTAFVQGYPGIVGTHDLIVHNYGPERSMATIHCEVSKDMDVMQSHSIIDGIERDAAHELGIMLVIHMDPVDNTSESARKAKALVAEVIKEIDHQLSFHDFRLIELSKKRTQLMFDLVTPWDYTEEKNEQVKQNIEQELKKRNPGFEFIIAVENSYVHK